MLRLSVTGMAVGLCLVLRGPWPTTASPMPLHDQVLSAATPTGGMSVGVPSPVPSQATIGQPADDGARIVKVDVLDARTRDLTIESPAVGAVQVRLLLPATFEARPTTRFSVLYLLHGAGGEYVDWTEETDVEALTAPTDLLVVMPAAAASGLDGWYTDWDNGGMGGPPMWETFHLTELRQLLERNWNAGDRRAIAGVSAGGYGAIEYAARQRGLFAFAGAYSGVFDPLGNVDFWNPPHDMWGDPIAQADVWKAHDPLLNAAALKGTALFVAYGNGKPGALDNYAVSPYDPSGEVEREVAAESAALVKRLHDLKIPVTVDAYGNGTHNGPYVERDFERSLPLILKALGE